jgi:hypothetical protein
MNAKFTTNSAVNTPVSGIGAGDSIANVTIAWILIGTDDAGRSDLSVQANLAASANAAVAAGRSISLVAGTNDAAIAALQTTAGTTQSVGALVAGATYVPAILWAEAKSGGGFQSGVWTKGTSVVNAVTTTTTTTTTAAPTTTTTAAPTTTTTAAPTTTTTAAPVPTANFNSAGIIDAGWSVVKTAGATATVAGGELVLVSPAVADAAILRYDTPLDSNRTWKIQARVKTGGSANDVVGLYVYQNTTEPVLSTSLNNAKLGCIFSPANGWILQWLDSNVTPHVYRWKQLTSVWDMTIGWTTTTPVIAANTYYTLEIESTSTQFRLAIYDATGTLLKQTPWQLWSAVTDAGTPYWLFIGDTDTAVSYSGTTTIDWVTIQ